LKRSPPGIHLFAKALPGSGRAFFSSTEEKREEGDGENQDRVAEISGTRAMLYLPDVNFYKGNPAQYR
jgi:hypothetical protein